MSVVEIRALRVELLGSGVDIVDEVEFSIDRGEVLGLVGESGSGKTTIATAMLGHARRGARIAAGSVIVDGIDVLRLAPEELRKARGKLVTYVPQDPTAALNPARRVNSLMSEMLAVHEPSWSEAQRLERIAGLLAEVGLPGDVQFARRYPHQLSGGQLQRVAIAMAFMLDPTLIVLDEPTTGLDVVTQERILQMLRALCEKHGTAAIYVTHDLAVVANIAHGILVAYAGRIVETGRAGRVFRRSGHPYTRHLIASIPVLSERRALAPIPGRAPSPGARGVGCSFAPRCPMALEICELEPPAAVEVAKGEYVRCVRAQEVSAPSAEGGNGLPSLVGAGATDVQPILAAHSVNVFYGARQVLWDINFDLRPRECLALVGESGSGKTTLARALVGVPVKRTGEITYRGELLAGDARSRPASVRQELQYVFQSPYSSLNPRRTVGQIISAPLQHFLGVGRREGAERVDRSLESVSLSARYADYYPDQLSGGERQRVALARALVCEPRVIVCDEITSSLDVSVQAAIVSLLRQLQEENDLALLFVTHNLALVRTIADSVMVIDKGKVVESGVCGTVLDQPQNGYTQSLVRYTPTLERSLGQPGNPVRAGQDR